MIPRSSCSRRARAKERTRAKPRGCGSMLEMRRLGPVEHHLQRGTNSPPLEGLNIPVSIWKPMQVLPMRMPMLGITAPTAQGASKRWLALSAVCLACACLLYLKAPSCPWWAKPSCGLKSSMMFRRKGGFCQYPNAWPCAKNMPSRSLMTWRSGLKSSWARSPAKRRWPRRSNMRLRACAPAQGTALSRSRLSGV